MMTLETYDLLSKYLKGELSASDTILIEHRLQTNISFKTQLDDMMLVDAALVDNKLREVETICKEEYRVNKKQNTIKKVALLSLGAVVLVGVCVYLWKDTKVTRLDVKEEINEPIYTETIPETLPERKVIGHEKKEFETIDEHTEATLPLVIIGEKVVSSQQEPMIVVKEDLPGYEVIKETNVESSPKRNETALREVIDSCSMKALKVNTTIEATCKNKENGSVAVEISDGFPPYVQQLFDADNEEVEFSDLSSGNYQLIVVDNQSCRMSSSIVIKEKVCAENLVFTPSLGETMEFGEEDGVLIIQEQDGTLCLQQSLENDFEWDGTSSKGEINYGLLIFKIEKEGDLSRFGTITILK